MIGLLVLALLRVERENEQILDQKPLKKLMVVSVRAKQPLQKIAISERVQVKVSSVVYLYIYMCVCV